MTVLDPVHVVCPHCHKTNRVAQQHLTNQPDCGSCHQPLFTGEPVQLDADSFAKQVGRSHLPVVVDFWAPWCGPCKMMAPAFEAAAKQLAPGVRLGKVDTEANPALGARFGVQSIPTLVLFRNGAEVGRLSGARPAGDIVHWTLGALR